MTSLIESISVPPGFGRIPLNSDDSERLQAAHQIAHLARGATSLPDDQDAASHISDTGALLNAYGAILAGALTIPDKPPDEAAFMMLSRQRLRTAGPELLDEQARTEYAHALQEELSSKEPLAEINILNLQCGPTVTVRRDVEYRLPPHISASGEESALPARSWQAMVPTPDNKALLILDLGSGNTENWDHFVDLAVSTIGSVRFTAEVE